MTVDDVLVLIEERTERFRVTRDTEERSIIRSGYDSVVDVLEGLHEDIAIAHYGGGNDCE